MDADLYEKGELKVEILEGDLVVKYEGLGGSVVMTAESGYFIDKLMEAIPGEIDDAVLNIIKGALNA